MITGETRVVVVDLCSSSDDDQEDCATLSPRNQEDRATLSPQRQEDDERVAKGWFAESNSADAAVLSVASTPPKKKRSNQALNPIDDGADDDETEQTSLLAGGSSLALHTVVQGLDALQTVVQDRKKVTFVNDLPLESLTRIVYMGHTSMESLWGVESLFALRLVSRNFRYFN